MLVRLLIAALILTTARVASAAPPPAPSPATDFALQVRAWAVGHFQPPEEKKALEDWWAAHVRYDIGHVAFVVEALAHLSDGRMDKELVNNVWGTGVNELTKSGTKYWRKNIDKMLAPLGGGLSCAARPPTAAETKQFDELLPWKVPPRLNASNTSALKAIHVASQRKFELEVLQCESGTLLVGEYTEAGQRFFIPWQPAGIPVQKLLTMFQGGEEPDPLAALGNTSSLTPEEELLRLLKLWLALRMQDESSLHRATLSLIGKIRFDIPRSRDVLSYVQAARAAKPPLPEEEVTNAILKIRGYDTKLASLELDEVAIGRGLLSTCKSSAPTDAELAQARALLTWDLPIPGDLTKEPPNLAILVLIGLRSRSDRTTEFRALECERGRIVFGWYVDREGREFVPFLPSTH